MVRKNAGKDSSGFILLLLGAGVFYLVWQTLGKSNVTTGAAATANILPGNIPITQTAPITLNCPGDPGCPGNDSAAAYVPYGPTDAQLLGATGDGLTGLWGI